MNEDQTIYRIQKSIVDNHNEFKEFRAKTEIEIKRLDLAITGIATLTRENTEWLAKCDSAIKQLREQKEPPKVRTFFDWLKGSK